MSVSLDAARPLLLLFESRASRTVDGTAVGAGRFCPAICGVVEAFCERVEGRDCCCWCWERSALALRRASSMRRTCSGVMGVLVAGACGGVVGRSVPAMIDIVSMDQLITAAGRCVRMVLYVSKV